MLTSGSARFSSDPRVKPDPHEIPAGVCGWCQLQTSRHSKTRLHFLDFSRIEQANRLAQIETGVQIEQNGISLSVCRYKLSLCGLSTCLVHSMWVDGIHFYEKPMRHVTIIDYRTDDKLVTPPPFLSAPLSFSALTMICELGMSQRQNQSAKNSKFFLALVLP